MRTLKNSRMVSKKNHIQVYCEIKYVRLGMDTLHMDKKTGAHCINIEYIRNTYGHAIENYATWTHVYICAHCSSQCDKLKISVSYVAHGDIFFLRQN